MKLSLCAFVCAAVLCFAAVASAQDIQTGVTYVCNGERLFVDGCNIHDTSDTSTCHVGHPDTVLPNGLMKYTTETRGTLKKLLPTCKQPSATDLKQAQAFQKKAQNAQNQAMGNSRAPQRAPSPSPAPVTTAVTLPPAGTAIGMAMSTNPDMRAMYRCIEAGRLDTVCEGNALQNDVFGMVENTVGTLVPGAADGAKNAPPPTGPQMNGVFRGNGAWRVEFSEDAAGVSCADLRPDNHIYSIKSVNDRAVLTIANSPNAIVLTLTAPDQLTGTGPVTITGFVPEGRKLLPATRTCVTPVMSSKGAGPGVVGTEENILENALGGKSVPTPPGLRMTGTYAASSGFSVEFHPESVIIGCGPEIGHAYPYTVTADGKQLAVNVSAPDHPLTLGINANNTLNPGNGQYLVRGRLITGKDDAGNLTFLPVNATCNLATLGPGSVPNVAVATSIPAGAIKPAVAPVSRNGAPPVATAAAPRGNAVLTITSGLPGAPRAANPLAGQNFVLLRDDLSTIVPKSGAKMTPGVSAPKTMFTACANQSSLDCQKILAYLHSESASFVLSDFYGKGVLPGVPPGTYYLMISTHFNNHLLFWGLKVELKAGANAITLNQQNATPMN